MKVWMKVTNDELELPVAMADSAEQLAEKLGVKKNTIYQLMYRAKKKGKQTCYRVVDIEDE